jgi:hypothetical protein
MVVEEMPEKSLDILTEMFNLLNYCKAIENLYLATFKLSEPNE